MVILYTTHCPKCRILEKKLNIAGVDYSASEKLDKLIRAGYSSAPMLELEDGSFLNFKEACKWADSQKG